jgi:hypothetical protein
MIIFLDIDGVLNNHTPMSNGYNGIDKVCVSNFNFLLSKLPSAKIVISSAWRYLIHGGAFTLKGFEYILETHGIECKDRLIGYTDKDPELPQNHDEWNQAGLQFRKDQILKWIKDNNYSGPYLVLDDLDIGIGYRTDGKIGLTCQDVYNILFERV